MVVRFLRKLQTRFTWRGFPVLGAMLLLAGHANLATAQNKDDILDRAAEVAEFLELLEHEQSLVRQMAIADGLASDNRYIRDAAIEAGLSSRDVMVRKEAIAGVLRTKPVFVIEVPVELDARLAAHASTKWWSVARLEMASEFFDPDNFRLRASNGYQGNNQDCVIRGDEVVCRGQQGGARLTLRPGVSGTLTGTVEDGDWKLPIVIRNF